MHTSGCPIAIKLCFVIRSRIRAQAGIQVSSQTNIYTHYSPSDCYVCLYIHKALYWTTMPTKYEYGWPRQFIVNGLSNCSPMPPYGWVLSGRVLTSLFLCEFTYIRLCIRTHCNAICTLAGMLAGPMVDTVSHSILFDNNIKITLRTRPELHITGPAITNHTDSPFQVVPTYVGTLDLGL